MILKTTKTMVKKVQLTFVGYQKKIVLSRNWWCQYMRKNVEALIVEQVVVNHTATNQFIAPPTWEPNRSPRHYWKDSATFARVIVRFIIEYLGKTNMSFK